MRIHLACRFGAPSRRGTGDFFEDGWYRFHGFKLDRTESSFQNLVCKRLSQEVIVATST